MLQFVLDPSLDIIKIRKWLLLQLWIVELIETPGWNSMHMPPMKPKQSGQSGSLVQFQIQHQSPQPAAFSPLPFP